MDYYIHLDKDSKYFEYIKISNYDKKELKKLNPDDLPLTGVCWDYEVISCFKANNSSIILNALHKDTEYQYSDEGLLDMCQANEYEFDEYGHFI